MSLEIKATDGWAWFILSMATVGAVVSFAGLVNIVKGIFK